EGRRSSDSRFAKEIAGASSVELPVMLAGFARTIWMLNGLRHGLLRFHGAGQPLFRHPGSRKHPLHPDAVNPASTTLMIFKGVRPKQVHGGPVVQE
ncbi:hypothetical protein PSYPI_03884, partial [Pseudomonas syringae pv. pisi str. 1704B]